VPHLLRCDLPSWPTLLRQSGTLVAMGDRANQQQGVW